MVYIIYNPISGNKGTSSRKKIEKELQKIKNSTLLKSEYPHHATDLVLEAIQNKAERIIVVGGDGTINEVARQLINSNIPLGIVPMGSGNGLARHLGIPMNFKKALDLALHTEESQVIDVAYFNDKPFFCTAGIGFDAIVAFDFSKARGRGLFNYVKSSLRQSIAYKNIEVRLNNENTYQPFFSITFANANQFGNNAYISPNSKLTDEEFELVVVKPLSFIEKAKLGISLFFKTIHKHPKVTISSIKHCTLEVKNVSHFHLDGESFELNNNLVKINLIPSCLKIFY
ncbi:MAG: Diacylglycerol kinase, partial [Bacteroidota bacterium]